MPKTDNPPPRFSLADIAWLMAVAAVWMGVLVGVFGKGGARAMLLAIAANLLLGSLAAIVVLRFRRPRASEVEKDSHSSRGGDSAD